MNEVIERIEGKKVRRIERIEGDRKNRRDRTGINPKLNGGSARLEQATTSYLWLSNPNPQ
jgi:hypothetical protein